MGALHKLVFILGKLDPHNEGWKARQLVKAEQIEDSSARESAIQAIEQAFERNALDYGRKLYLLENCIYGVDIQPIAVQIAKLRCFISLVVDQRTEDSHDNRGIIPLPNLETKFVAANTLLAIGNRQQMIRSPQIIALEKDLTDVRHRHFTARTPATKRKYRERDRQIRTELSEHLKHFGLPADAARQLAAWDPYDQNASADFFDSEWMFGLPIGKVRVDAATAATVLGNFALVNELPGQMELAPTQEIDSGFDIVIGNPPYVRQEQIKELKPALKEHYDCYTGVADLYVYFYERGHELLKPGGVLTYISSNKYFRAGYGEKLRTMLASRSIVQQLIDFGDAPVFTAIAYPSIFIGRKGDSSSNEVRALTWQPGKSIGEFPSVFQANSFLIAQKRLTPDGWRLETPAVFRLLEKLRQAGTPLGEYVKGRFYRGILTGFNEAFVVDRATRDQLIAEHPSSAELLKPFLRGRDVKRWVVQPQDLWLIFTRRGINIQKYPAILEHLSQYRKRLTPGVRGGRKPGCYEWYEIQDSIAYWQEFEQGKILYPDIYEHQSFALDLAGFYANNTCYFIPTDEDWLCGLFNSLTVEWFYSRVSNAVRGGYLRAFSDYMRQIPIPSGTQSGAIGGLVHEITDATRVNPITDVTDLERQIDAHVYALYGLTREEIAMVEEG